MWIKGIICMMLFLFSIMAFGQKIKVQETTAFLGGKKNNALEVIIYETTEEKVIKEWRSLMKEYDAKVAVNDEVFADNAVMRLLSDNTVDVYAKTEKVGENEVKLTVGFDLGGAFLCRSLNKEQCRKAETIVEEFARKLTLEGISEQLKDARKVLGKLKDQKESLENQQRRLERDIESYKEKLAKAEADLIQNRTDQDAKQKEVDAQSKVAYEIKDKEKDFK